MVPHSHGAYSLAKKRNIILATSPGFSRIKWNNVYCKNQDNFWYIAFLLNCFIFNLYKKVILGIHSAADK